MREKDGSAGFLAAVQKPNRWRGRLVRFLACLVVFCTTYALILPAITMERATFCGLDEHTHSDACYERKLVCPLEEDETHTHTEECYERVCVCEQEEHIHTAACFSDPEADLEEPEQWEATLPEELSGDWAKDLIAVAESQLDYTESSDNYAVSEDETLRGYTRYGAWYGSPYEDWSALFVSFCLHYAGIPEEALPRDADCGAWAERLKQLDMIRPAGDELPHAGDLLFFDLDGDGCADRVGIVVSTDDGVDVIEGDADGAVALRRIAWGEEGMSDCCPLPAKPAEPPKDMVFTGGTDTVSVRVEAPAGAFPEGTTMSVSAVAAEQVLDAVSDAVSGEVVHVDAVEILFTCGGREIEPALPIRVSMQPAKAKAESAPVVVHVQDDGSAEQVEAEPAPEGEDGVQFVAESFSVYALVYTVDFEWEVDGKTYSCSLPGGGFADLESLVELLGIVKQSPAKGPETGAEEDALTLDGVQVSDETKKFVADVEKAEFSRPDLVWVGRAQADSSVGALKEENGLAVRCSAELSEAQIAEINAQPVSAGDWVLISVKPFLSEESLTVTMKNGDVFTIRVTDAQITQKHLAADGNTYEITLTYGEDAQLPDGAELQVEEVLPGAEAYQTLLAGAADKLGFDAEAITYARFFDIDIVADGRVLEPSAEVSVRITLADDAPEELKVVHFTPDGPAVIEARRTEAEQEGEAQLRFLTDGFSTYGVICGPGPQSVDDLAGFSAKIGIGSNWLLAEVLDGESPTKIKKGSEADAAEWTFEAGGTGGTYRIYTMVNGQRQYINFGDPDGSGGANVTLSETPQDLTVSTSTNGTYQISATVNGTNTYYLNEYGGAGGYGFAGWYAQNDNNARLTFSFSEQPAVPGGRLTRYMVLVKIDDQYYILLNSGELEEVANPVDGDISRIAVEDPMFWSYTHDEYGDHLYHEAEAAAYTDQQIASDYLYRYIDPTRPDALRMDELAGDDAVTLEPIEAYPHGATVSARPYWDDTYVTYDEANHTISADSDPSKLLKVVEEGGRYRIVGADEPGQTAEVYLARRENPELRLDASYHTVNHIDISVEAVAAIDVPLAYGTYYYIENGSVKTLIVNSSNHMMLSLSQKDIGVDEEDMKKGHIEAYTKGENGEHIPVHDAYTITGYSSNEQNNESTDQVRIAGTFKVADLDPVPDGNGNGSDYWRQQRLNNRIYYSVSTTKDITFPMVYNQHQLFTSRDAALASMEEGYNAAEDQNALKVSSTITLSASFDYWDSRNECPGIWAIHNVEDWSKGDIFCDASDEAGNLNSGMDFALGAVSVGDNSTTAIEITKYLVDANKHLITPNRELPHSFHVYRRAIDKNADPNPIDEVKGVDVDAYDPNQTQPGYTGYTLLHDKTAKVGDGGMGIVYDYEVPPGMVYVEEDKDTVQQVLTDVNGKKWTYQGTYLETEYVWRNDGIEYRRHVSQTYTDEDQAYNSIPDVLGAYRDVDGIDRFNGFLEFYVYNIYDQDPTDIPVEKTWTYQNGRPAEAPEDARVTVTLGRYKLVEDAQNPVTGNLRIDQTVEGLPEGASFQATYKVKRDGITVRTGSYDPSAFDNGGGALISGLPAGEYTVEIASFVAGHDVADAPQQQTVTVTNGQTAQITFASTVSEKQAVSLIPVRVTNSTATATNYQNTVYYFPAGSSIAVNFSRPGSGHNAHFNVTVTVNGTQVEYTPPAALENQNHYAGVDQTLYFDLPSSLPEGQDEYQIDIRHDWDRENLWINSVSLYVSNDGDSGTDSTNGTNAANGRLLAAPRLRAAAALTTRDVESDYTQVPDSTVPGMLYAVDESWSVTAELNAPTWERVLEGLDSTDEHGNRYLYFIKSVHEEGVPEGTVVTITTGQDGKVLNSDGGVTLGVANTLPNEPPKIKIKKVDENGVPMTDVPFTITMPDGTTESFTVTSGDGVYTLEDLAPGNYVINEGTPPAGYTAMQGSILFTVTADYLVTDVTKPDGVDWDGDALIFTVPNTPSPNPGTITVRKQWLDSYGNVSEPGAAGVTLTLRRTVDPRTLRIVVNIAGKSVSAEATWNIVNESAYVTWNDNSQYFYDQSRGAWNLNGQNLTVTYDRPPQPQEGQSAPVRFRIDGLQNVTGGGAELTFTYSHSEPGDAVYTDWFESTIGGAVITIEGTGNGIQNSDDWSQSLTLNAENGWNQTLSNLAITDSDGRAYRYYISEDSVPAGYTVSYSGSNDGTQGVLTAYNRADGAEIRVVKVDKNDRSLRLNGAAFALRQIDPAKTGTMGTRALEGGRTDSGTTAGEGANEGTLVFRGLTPGYYEIRETAAPEGYQLNGDPSVYIRITDQGVEMLEKDESRPAQSWTVISRTPTAALEYTTLTVSDKPGVELPHTGGPGTLGLTLSGGLLSAGALVCFGCVGRRRRRRGRDAPS